MHVSSFMYSINRHLFTLLISPTCPLPRTHLPMFSPVRGIIKFRIRPSEGILLPASEHVLMETTSHLQPRLLSLFEYINHSKSHFWPRFECGAEQGALYVGNLCSLEIINTNTPKRVSCYMVIILPFLTDRAALLIVEWHLEEWEKTLSLQRPTSPPGLGARVTIVLGSGVSEEKTWRLSMSYLLMARA